jgi:drug/metabolite transporter (DMT)-like permease
MASSSQWSYYVAIAICAVLFSVVVGTFATLVPKDSSQNTKLLTVVSVFSFAASITAYALALYHFSSNPSHLIQFLLAITMMVILPAALIAASISTITISNLRDNLAASQ